LPSSYEWLQRLLSGHHPTIEDLEQLVRDCPIEDEHIEGKGGAWIAADGAAAELRRYVAAFANVSGGVILPGFADDLPRN